jgi:hypothetical protein
LNWQGRRELNSQPLVLETSALPIELHPCKPDEAILPAKDRYRPV